MTSIMYGLLKLFAANITFKLRRDSAFVLDVEFHGLFRLVFTTAFVGTVERDVRSLGFCLPIDNA